MNRYDLLLFGGLFALVALGYIIGISSCACADSPILTTAIQIRDLPQEMAYAFRGGECVFWVKGEQNSFWFPGIELLNGTTVLHNHPEGGPFSYKDLAFAAKANISTMLVSTHEGLWSTSRPFKEWRFVEWNE